MNTKIRISIWIVVLFLVFSGIGLSSQKALAASGSSIQRTALISVYHGYALATVYDRLPSSVSFLRRTSQEVSLTTLNVNDIDESRLIEAHSLQALARSSALTSLSVNDIDESRLIEAYNLQALARFSALTSRSVNDIDESRLIKAYSLQALSRFSALTSLSVNDIAESRLIEAYSSRVRYNFELHPRPWR
jgi:hypothetical protein